MLRIPNNGPYLPLPWFPFNFTSLPNLMTHLIVRSLKLRKKIRPLNPTISFANSFLLHLITFTSVIRIYSCNWSWIRCHMVFSGLQTTSQIAKKTSSILKCHKKDDISPLFIFTFIQTTLVANHSCICNYKPLLVIFMTTICFYYDAMEDSCINSQKNG
jgi:hypothetical protein